MKDYTLSNTLICVWFAMKKTSNHIREQCILTIIKYKRIFEKIRMCYWITYNETKFGVNSFIEMLKEGFDAFTVCIISAIGVSFAGEFFSVIPTIVWACERR